MADQLAANCISAVNIVSSGIKANEILVPGTITGNYIKANSIYASNLREDIMCKELWRNPNPTSSFSEQSVYSQVSGVSFADYTAAFIFCTNGAASCIVLRGTATTMISKSYTSGSTQTGWFWGTWNTNYDSYSARQVIHNTDHLYFYSSQNLGFGSFHVDAPPVLEWTAKVYPHFDTKNDTNIPYRIFGIRFGTLPQS